MRAPFLPLLGRVGRLGRAVDAGLWRGPRSAGAVGIDLGERRTQVVRVEPGGGPGAPHITLALDEPTPEGVFREGRMVAPGAASGFLAELAAAHGLRGVEAALALAVPDGHLKRLVVRDGPREEVLAELRERPEMRLGGGAEALRIDFHPLGRAGPDRLVVLAAAARAEAVAQLQEVAAGAGLVPGLVALPSSALTNLLEAGHPGVAGAERSVLVHLGFGGVQVVVLHRGVPAGAYEADAGVRLLVGRARREKPGVPAAVLEGELADPDLAGAWRARVEEWARGDLLPEVRRGIGIAARESGIGDMHSVGDLWLSGGGARMPGVGAILDGLLRTGDRDRGSVRLLDAEALADGARCEAPGPAHAVAAGVAVEALRRAAGAHAAAEGAE